MSSMCRCKSTLDLKLFSFSFQNYNKSRIHSFRGAKDVIIKLNDIIIFYGEIAKASGDDMGSLDSFGDVRNFVK